MKFYTQFIRSFRDLPGYHSLLIHSLVGCNFSCFSCHNYEELVLKKDLQQFYSPEDIVSHLKQNGYFFDALIFSGGEFLLENSDEIIAFLSEVKSVFKGVIIINTNGSFPEKIKLLIGSNLVDGFHVDLKLPYHLLDIKDDLDIYKRVLGINPTESFIEKLISSIEIVIQHNSPYSKIRTVKYPILSDEFFIENQKFIAKLNQKYNSNVVYTVNEFLDINEN